MLIRWRIWSHVLDVLDSVDEVCAQRDVSQRYGPSPVRVTRDLETARVTNSVEGAFLESSPARSLPFGVPQM